jgi:hypothetical protein
MEIIVAVIGGLFSLAGIWLKHLLDARAPPPTPAAPVSEAGRRREAAEELGRRTAAGAAKIWAGLALLGLAGAIFLLLSADAETIDVPDLVGWVLFFVGSACLVSALYLLAAGIFAKFK